MNYELLAFKNLTQRRVRTGLTLFSMAVAVAVLFTLLSFNKGYERALWLQLQQTGVHLMVVPIGCPFEAASVVQKGGEIKDYLSDDILPQIEQLPGVQIAAPALMHPIVRPEEGRTDIYLGIDERMLALKNWWRLAQVQTETADSIQFTETTMAPGPDLLQEKDSILLGYDAALIELRKPGDKLYIPELDQEFTVTGVLAPTGTQDDGFFYLPLTTAQQLFRKPHKLTVVQIRLADPAQAGSVGEELEKVVPKAEIISMSELLGTMMTLIGSAKTLIFSIVFIAMVISALGVLNTVLMSVFERTQEIGILRATGASRFQVFSLIWLETLILSVLGGLLGLALALGGAHSLEGLVKRFLPLAPRGSVVALDLRVFVLGLLFVIGLGLGAGLYPAFRASRANPIEALRRE